MYLQTKRLHLLQLHIDDVAALYPIWSDADVTKYMNITTFKNIDDAKAMTEFMLTYIQEGKATRYTIRLNTSEQIIGTIGINNLSTTDGYFELGYELAHNSWGHGYATEILTSFMEQFAKDTPTCIGFVGWVVEENTASIHLLKKLGFKELPDMQKQDELEQTLLYFVKDL